LNDEKSILVGIYSLDRVGGAELYTCDLIRQLKQKDNIAVEFYAMVQGKLADYVSEELQVRYMSKERYDLILVTHNAAVEALYGKGPIIQICHGAILDLEFPSVYADYHVGISKEICDSLDSKGFPNCLVLNGLDLNQKYPIRPPNETLKRVLSLCQSEEANAMLQNACNRLEVEFVSFNKHENPVFNIEQEINKADLVVGIGRSIYDAMACGRPCVVFDSRGYNGNKGDGYLHPELFDTFVRNNCSGRFRNRAYTEEELVLEIQKYNAADGARLRQIAEKQLNVVNTAEALLDTVRCISPETRRKKRYRIVRDRLTRLRTSFRHLRRSFKRKLKQMMGIERAH